MKFALLAAMLVAVCSETCFAMQFEHITNDYSGQKYYIDIDSIQRDYAGNIRFKAYKAPSYAVSADQLTLWFVRGNCITKLAGINGRSPQVAVSGTIMSELLTAACMMSN